MNRRLDAWRLLVEILFAAGTRDEDAALRETLERGMSATRWLDVISHANVGKVTAALWSALQQRGLEDLLGADERAYLASFYELNRSRNATIETQICVCLERLGRAGIAALPIKGAAYVLAQLHGDCADRYMADIDLLVPEQAARAARNILIGEGYRESEADAAPPDHHHLTALLHDDMPVAVELHTAVVPKSLEAALPTRSVWDRAETHGEGGSRYLLPSATDQATISFLHAELVDRGTELFLIPLRPYHDLHVMERGIGPEISWNEVAARAAKVGGATRFERYAYVYARLSGTRLLPESELRFSMTDAASYRLCLTATAWPQVALWRLRADSLSERRLRETFSLAGGALELNAYRARQALGMLKNALTGRSRT